MEVFKNCLQKQLCNHACLMPQDVVKLCYQAACGAEHLLSDLGGAKDYFDAEYRAVSPRNEPLYEPISAEVCRINLGAWKAAGLPSEWLFRMFADTVFQTDGKIRLQDYLLAAEAVLEAVGYDMDAWHSYLTAYKAQGMPAVRHSAQYRAQEQPSYRIVCTKYLSLISLLKNVQDPADRHATDEQGM